MTIHLLTNNPSILPEDGIGIDEYIHSTGRAEVGRNNRAASLGQQLEMGTFFTQGRLAIDTGHEELPFPADYTGLLRLCHCAPLPFRPVAFIH
jgi:hypothetical protein